VQRPTKCVVCKTKTIRCRGLCEKHYSQAYYEVEVQKRTTWRKLERAGLALPKAKTRDTGSKFRKAIAQLK
jgi:hypothetical protein